MNHHQQQHDALNALRQAEIEARAPTLLALGLQEANAEYLADLAVFLNDALAVHQPETVGGGRLVGYHFMVEHVVEHLLAHAAPGIADGNLHIVGRLAGRNIHLSVASRELSGVICQGVQHEERQHAVGLDNGCGGLHLKRHSFHGKAGLAASHHVEELLQGEALDVQGQFTLAQLNPLGQQVVLRIDVIGQFADVFYVLRIIRRRLRMYAVWIVQVFGFMQNTVDERKDAHGERNLGALFQLAALISLHAQSGLSHLFVLLLQQVIKLVVFLLFPVEMVEEPQEEEQQDDGAKDCPYHEGQLVHGMVQQTGTRLEFAVLAGLLLQVDIDVAVIVAVGFVVDSRISHAELFADTGHQVGSLTDAAVDEGTVQIQQGTLVVLHRMIA